jgi:autotransporter passenger strand-loop-strand repeat protein
MTTVTNGQTYTISSGVIETDDLVLPGGTLIVSGSALHTLNSGWVIVEPGGFTSGTVIDAHGLEIVYGTTSSTIVNGGSQDVWGTASGTIINGGVEIVERGGTAIGTTVNSGSEQIHGIARGTTRLPVNSRRRSALITTR